jgi:hypothetical protein
LGGRCNLIRNLRKADRKLDLSQRFAMTVTFPSKRGDQDVLVTLDDRPNSGKKTPRGQPSP